MEKHQKKTKYCISIQKKLNVETKELLNKCEFCDKSFEYDSYKRHQKVCTLKKDKTIINLSEEIILLKDELNKLKQTLHKYEIENKRLLVDNLNLEKKLEKHEEKLYTMASRPTIEIDIDGYDSKSEYESECESEDQSEDQSEEYKLTPLELGNGYIIEHRDEDGFINVTNLCKAGKKQFKHWKSIEKTKAFLRVLSLEVGLSSSELIKLGTGSKNIKNSEQCTWVHPQVAINIAQWISPTFDVKVSGWVYEVMMTGKVDITNTKSYKELQKENKNKDIKIQFLTKKYVKSQPRVQYEEKNVIYILTTKLMKKDRRYILGKAVDLTTRLSTYNKSDEHEVIYFASCKDVETMNIVENIVFSLLNQYREQANRERFVLPENEKIELFSNAIKKSIEVFK
jgi:hypothetical protein